MPSRVHCRSVIDPFQFFSVLEVFRPFDIPHHSTTLHQHQYPPTRISLTLPDTQYCRAGKRVMIVMPILAHGDQAAEPDVIALYRCVSHIPVPATGIMGSATNQPAPNTEMVTRAHIPQMIHTQTPISRGGSASGNCCSIQVLSIRTNTLSFTIPGSGTNSGGLSRLISQCSCHRRSRHNA